MGNVTMILKGKTQERIKTKKEKNILMDMEQNVNSGYLRTVNIWAM